MHHRWRKTRHYQYGKCSKTRQKARMPPATVHSLAIIAPKGPAANRRRPVKAPNYFFSSLIEGQSTVEQDVPEPLKNPLDAWHAHKLELLQRPSR